MRTVDIAAFGIGIAIEVVFGFTLLAGILVLFAAIASSRTERQREAAVMRALGASSTMLQTALIAEFTLLGVLAAGGLPVRLSILTSFTPAGRLNGISGLLSNAFFRSA